MMRTRSVTWIQDIHCCPSPMVVAAPSFAGNSAASSAGVTAIAAAADAAMGRGDEDPSIVVPPAELSDALES